MKSKTNASHYISSLQNSRAEMFTTDLGLAAYNGQRNIVAKALAAGVNWDVESEFIFSSAIFGQQWEIARDILKAGMPISDKIYIEIYNWGHHSLLNELPPRPDLLKPLQDEAQKNNFFYALIDGDLTQVKNCFKQTWVNTASEILADRVQRFPIHYAAAHCNLVLIKFLVDNGANVNALTGDGKSALTITTTCLSADNLSRKECYQFLTEQGGLLIPPIDGWFKRWRLSRGAHQ